jgi:plasmid replication initiation protein
MKENSPEKGPLGSKPASAKKRTPANQLSIMGHVDKAVRMLFQANALTVANYEMSALQKNIFYMVQSQLGADDPPNKEYTIRIKDLGELTNVANPYVNLRVATKTMMQKILEIPIDGNLLQVAPFSSVFYNTSEGTITICIDPKLRPFLFNLDNRFTTYGFHQALLVSGKYTKRLYEMFSQWKKMGLMKVSLTELKKRLRLLRIDEESGLVVEQYPDWDNFKRRVLDPAVKEINENTDIEVTYYPEREGRKIMGMVCTIKIKNPELQLPAPSELQLRLIDKFGLRDDQAKYVLNNYDSVFIMRKLYEIEVKNSSRKILNLGAYTAKVFGVL